MKINEIFLSIQGEGIEIGLPTIFIRTAGCNLRCLWCDTKYAYFKGKQKTISYIINQCKKFKIKRVCITGGEPLMQRLECIKLIKCLIKNRFNISLETNGSISIKDLPEKMMISLDIKCPSSGMTKNMCYNNLDLIKQKDQVKFVIANLKDYIFAKNIIKKYALEDKTNVIFQPVYRTKFTQKLVNIILQNKLKVRFLLQLHKIIWGDKRGV
jgi:7-carboxy-7-deazaguanine synthase